MCFVGKVAKTIAKVSPLGAIGVASSLFGNGKKGKDRVRTVETYNPRGSYIDPKTGNTILPAEVRAALGSTGVAAPSLFAKNGG